MSQPDSISMIKVGNDPWTLSPGFARGFIFLIPLMRFAFSITIGWIFFFFSLLSVSLPVYPSAHLFIYLTVSVSIYASVFVSVYVSM